jgi:hypothetical protein
MVDLLVDFRSRGWSGSAETFGPWREITCAVMGASWTRGSPEHRGLLNFPENGQASLTLIDPERVLDPGNASGIYYGQIDVGAELRLRFAGRQVFIGRITTLDHQFQPRSGAEAVAIARIAAQGYQGKLALIPFLACSTDGFYADIYAAESTSVRVNRILDHCAIPAADRDIEAGGVQIIDVDFGVAVGVPSAWDELLNTMTAELGSIELTTDGKIRTRNRNTVWGSEPAATLHLGCDAHAGAIDIVDAEFATVRDTVRNHVKITVAENDVVGPSVDAPSQAKYGLRMYDELNRCDFSSMAAWVPYFLDRMKAPMRQWRVTLRPTTQAQIDAIETVFLYTSRAHVVIDDIGGALIDLNLRPVGVEWSVDPAGLVAVMALGDQGPATPSAGIVKYRTAIMATSGLVGYWRLGEGSTSSPAVDEKAARNGSYAGSPLPTLGANGATNDSDSAATFALSNWVNVPHATGLNLLDAWTIEAWVKPTTLTSGAARYIVSKGPGAYGLRINTAGYLEMTKADTQVICHSSVPIQAGSWSYVVATKNASSFLLYVTATDRTVIDMNATTVNNTTALTIGGDITTGGAHRESFVGTIDEVAIYNRALSLSEIAAHYTARA